MKLISCYIENFGNIKQRNFNFDKGLTSVCEHNGYGKTTLASFLKAMFYGLKQTTVRDKELGERARFYPFEGGKFGGNVVFEKGGYTYKIERFFGKKSATEDTLAVYCGGEPLADAEDIGKEFFGLDEQSFLRTVFINSADTESGATGDISRMLNGFVDDADFDGAKKILEKQSKEYKAGRGSGGKISEKHEEILRLNATIDNKEKIYNGLSRKYEGRRVLAGEIAALEVRQRQSRDNNLVMQKWQTYDGFVADAEAEREKLNAVSGKYPEGLPTAEEIQSLKDNAENLKLAGERLSAAEFSAKKRIRLEELSARFAGGTPEDSEIASANDTAAELIRLEAEAANYERLISGGGEHKFPMGIPNAEEVDRYGEKLISLREKNHQTTSPSGKKIPLIAGLIALLLVGAGVGLIFVQMIVGIVLIAVGVLCVLAAVLLYVKVQINGIKAAEGRSDALENEIRSFLARYGYYSDGGAEVDFNNLTRDIEIYNSTVGEREKNIRLAEQKRTEADGAKSRLFAFLNRYGFTGENAQSDLTRLGAMVAEYAVLNGEKDSVSARIAQSRTQSEECARAVREILEKYSIAQRENIASLASEIERDGAEQTRLKENIIKLEKRAEAFKAENSLDERPNEAEDVVSIDRELSQKRDELSLLDREISDDEASVERLAELREERETAIEEEAVLNRKYGLIKKTLAYLERAEQNLKDRYISPVKNSFLNYSGLLEKALGEKVTFDKDFKVRFERNGEDRSDAHLSAGQKSLCTLCLRLALIDNMYREENPFIIMDDPFVHLDGEHMRRAEILLKEISKHKQIIYFCCHESRKI